MDERDPGDESNDAPNLETCAFCGADLYGRRVWCTPVFPCQETWSLFEAQELSISRKLVCETLYTCRGACADQAQAFAREHRLSPAKKQTRLYRARLGL